MTLVRALSLVLLLAVPGAAAAQDSRLTERLDTATAASVQQVVDSARGAGSDRTLPPVAGPGPVA